MSQPSQPSDLPTRAALARLDQPENLQTVLRKEAKDYDCLSCRVMGATAFIGLGGYTYWSGHSQLRRREQEILRSGSKVTMAARGLGITSTAGALVALGLYRFFG